MSSSNPESPESPAQSAVPASAQARQEVRCAVRFPLSLSVMLEGAEGEISALTRNISASGVLLALDQALAVGLDIHFSMLMPHGVLGSPKDVMVQCKGRVVRCSSSHNGHLAAATIDDYQFTAQ